MPNYRRFYIPGGTYFFTLVTYRRNPVFADPKNVDRLRRAAAEVRHVRPFDFLAAVVLTDHMHFLWALPHADTAYSWRIGRLKVLFSRSLDAQPSESSPSRRRRRETDIWSRRFWEHSIRDGEDFERHLHYIHYNPVKHGLAPCPHAWPHSSFSLWVARGDYDPAWGCTCQERGALPPDIAGWTDIGGE
jgi:putative transposase